MDTVFTADVATLATIVGVFLPILVGIVTKEVASSGLKATLLAGLSAVSGLVSSAIEVDGVFTKTALFSAVTTFVIAVATYYGYWKPTQVAPAVQRKTDQLGIGLGKPSN